MTVVLFLLAMLVVFLLLRMLDFFAEGWKLQFPFSDGMTFEERWPAISDDEFMQRCPKGTRRETALAVRRIVSEQLGLPYDHIHPDQNFVNDLGCD